MANKLISDLNAAAALTGTELVEVTQAGASAQTTTGAIAALAPSGVLLSGQLTLVAGTQTVTNAAITATSKVAFSVTSASYSATTGFILPVAATGSVTFYSSNTSDVSVLNYSILP